MMMVVMTIFMMVVMTIFMMMMMVMVSIFMMVVMMHMLIMVGFMLIFSRNDHPNSIIIVTTTAHQLTIVTMLQVSVWSSKCNDRRTKRVAREYDPSVDD